MLFNWEYESLRYNKSYSVIIWNVTDLKTRSLGLCWLGISKLYDIAAWSVFSSLSPTSYKASYIRKGNRGASCWCRSSIHISEIITSSVRSRILWFVYSIVRLFYGTLVLLLVWCLVNFFRLPLRTNLTTYSSKLLILMAVSSNCPILACTW